MAIIIALGVTFVFHLSICNSPFHNNKLPAHAGKKLAQERRFARASLSAQVIVLNYLQFHVRSKINVSEIQSFLLMNQKVTVTSAAVATMTFLFRMCDCTFDSDGDTGDFSLVLRILHV